MLHKEIIGICVKCEELNSKSLPRMPEKIQEKVKIIQIYQKLKQIDNVLFVNVKWGYNQENFPKN